MRESINIVRTSRSVSHLLMSLSMFSFCIAYVVLSTALMDIVAAGTLSRIISQAEQQ